LFLKQGPSNHGLANVALAGRGARRRLPSTFSSSTRWAMWQAFWLLGYIGGHTNMHVAFSVCVRNYFPFRRWSWLIGGEISAR